MNSLLLRACPARSETAFVAEIKRAAKVQSAPLEAIEERQVTVGGETHLCPSPLRGRACGAESAHGNGNEAPANDRSVAGLLGIHRSRSGLRRAWTRRKTAVDVPNQFD